MGLIDRIQHRGGGVSGNGNGGNLIFRGGGCHPAQGPEVLHTLEVLHLQDIQGGHFAQ